MKKNQLVILVLVLIVVGTGLWWFLGHQGHNEGRMSSGSLKEAAKYVCPMHPQITSDKPGSCSICGMDLVPVENEEADEHEGHSATEHDEFLKNQTSKTEEGGASAPPSMDMKNSKPSGHANFKLSLKKQQMIGVKIGKVERKSLFKTIRAPGRIAFDPELYTAQSEYLEAIKQWTRVKDSPIAGVKENTSQMIRSSKIRLQVLGLSDGQIKALAKKGSQSEGLLVSGKGQDSWVYADVYEVDLPYIRKGLSVQITANFLQGKTLAAKVISADQVINPSTRTAKIRIQLDKTDSSIRPESYVNVSIFSPMGEHTVVPLEAIMDTGRDIYVFVKKGEGRFEPRKVIVMLETDDEVAIAKGVEPGEEIVIGGNFMLDSESRLKAVIQGATANNGHEH